MRRDGGVRVADEVLEADVEQLVGAQLRGVGVDPHDRGLPRRGRRGERGLLVVPAQGDLRGHGAARVAHEVDELGVRKQLEHDGDEAGVARALVAPARLAVALGVELEDGREHRPERRRDVDHPLDALLARGLAAHPVAAAALAVEEPLGHPAPVGRAAQAPVLRAVAPEVEHEVRLAGHREVGVVVEDPAQQRRPRARARADQQRPPRLAGVARGLAREPLLERGRHGSASVSKRSAAAASARSGVCAMRGRV